MPSERYESRPGRRRPARLGLGAVMLLVVGVLIGTTITNSSSRPQLQPASLKDSCGADVLFIGAAGSGDLSDEQSIGFGPTVLAAEHAMSDAFRPHNVVGEPVEYQAVSVPLVILSGKPSTYTVSEQGGVTALENKLAQWASKCQNYRFVLAGYSQGADVVADALVDLASRSASPNLRNILDRIVGVALLGDPRYNPADPVDVTRPTPDRKGIFATFALGQPGLRPVFAADLQARVGSWCLPGDVICNTNPSLAVVTQIAPCKVLTSACPHLHYADWGVAAEAGRWLARVASTSLGVSAPQVPSPSTIVPVTPTTTKPVPPVTSTMTTTVAVTPTTTTSVPPKPTGTTATTHQAPTVQPPQTPVPPPAGPGDVPPTSDPGQNPLPAGARELGGVDLNRYCSAGWGMHAMLRYQVAWGWRCSPSTIAASGNREGDQNISVDDACAQQYQLGAKSHYRDYSDPASWFCWIEG